MKKFGLFKNQFFKPRKDDRFATRMCKIFSLKCLIQPKYIKTKKLLKNTYQRHFHNKCFLSSKMHVAKLEHRRYTGVSRPSSLQTSHINMTENRCTIDMYVCIVDRYLQVSIKIYRWPSIRGGKNFLWIFLQCETKLFYNKFIRYK